LIAINSPNNIDPLLQTGISSSTNTIAPAPHGPGLLRIRIYRSTRNKKKNRTTYNIFGQSNSNWNTYPTLEN
jgi:hypothetical protein